MNLKTAVGERRIRQAEGREDVARKAVAPKRVNCEAVGFRYRSLAVAALQHPDSAESGNVDLSLNRRF